MSQIEILDKISLDEEDTKPSITIHAVEVLPPLMDPSALDPNDVPVRGKVKSGAKVASASHVKLDRFNKVFEERKIEYEMVLEAGLKHGDGDAFVEKAKEDVDQERQASNESMQALESYLQQHLPDSVNLEAEVKAAQEATVEALVAVETVEVKAEEIVEVLA